MRQSILSSVVCTLFFVSNVYSSCVNPELKVKTFANSDATILTHISFIVEFSLKCEDGVQGLNLYASLDNNLVPVCKLGDNKYQISWVEEVPSESVGTRHISLYDEDGYTHYRKAVRMGEDIKDVPTISSFDFVHHAAYRGPWLKSEFIAAALSLAVAYTAFSSRAKLLL